jgi:hypothetical protein
VYVSSEGVYYATEYGVPDSRHLPEIKIESVRVKTFPILGTVIDVPWKGVNTSSGIGERLSNDPSIRSSIMVSSDVTITRPLLGPWLMSRNSEAPPSREQWSCLQEIAR